MTSMQGGKGVLSGAALSVLVLSSCATQQEVQEAYDLAKLYEREKYELANENARLLQDNERLTDQLRAGDIRILETGTPTAIQDRLSQLQAKIDNLGRPLGDIETFDVTGGSVIMIQDKLLFESGKAELGQEGRDALRGIATQIRTTPHERVYVRGHTDTDPVKKPETRAAFPHGNIQLSAARAVAVAALLIEAEPSLEKDLTVMGFGPHEPLKPNDSAANKRLNRRVEIFVQD